MPSPAPVVYVTDLDFERFDPADLFDLAFVLRSPQDHALTGVCLASGNASGRRVLDALTLEAGTDLPPLCDGGGLADMLASAHEPVNLVVVAGYRAVADALTARPDLREKVARLFIVGGQANDYASPDSPRRLPIDPRLRASLPQRFAPGGDPRIATVEDRRAWAALLASGQGVIWLPRDICLWRYAAPGILGRGETDPLAAFLLREAFWSHLQTQPDRYRAAELPVDLSALPALLLARRPDPTIWLRLFRAVTARVETDAASGSLTWLDLASDRPNLYLVSAIDGQALGKMMTGVLRRGSSGKSADKQGVQ